MESIESLDKECSALGGLFQQVVNDMKVGTIFDSLTVGIWITNFYLSGIQMMVWLQD